MRIIRMTKIKYTKELLEDAVKDCLSFTQLCKKLGLIPKGGNYNTLKEKIVKYDINIDHFTGQGWNKVGHPSFGKFGQSLDNLFVENSRYSSANMRKRIINNQLKEYKCEVCGITEWLSQKITIELHHINGNHYDNRLENLQFLCPNCHSQTHNFCNSNNVT